MTPIKVRTESGSVFINPTSISTIQEAGLASRYRGINCFISTTCGLNFAVIADAETIQRQIASQSNDGGYVHTCYLWLNPVTLKYEVGHCNHPTNELIKAYTKRTTND